MDTPRGAHLLENLHFGFRTEGKPVDVHSVYHVRMDQPTLGVGMHGPVYKAVHRQTKVEYAVKTLSMEDARSEEDLHDLKNELMLLARLDHPNIAKLYEVYQTDKSIYLVIELCHGGELLDRLNNQGTFSDEQARMRIKEMVDVIRYLHSYKIAHCDLKCENWLFATADLNSPLKLIDFGFAKVFFALPSSLQLSSSASKGVCPMLSLLLPTLPAQHFKQGESLPQGAVGTQFYIAPEMLMYDKSYDEQADMWSLGVITFMCLCGRPPFWGDDYNATLALIKKATFSFGAQAGNCSEAGRQFIEKLLVVDPRKRMSSRDAQGDPWFSSGTPEERVITSDIVHSLTEFRKMNAFQRTVCEVLAFMQLSSAELDGLREEFQKLDSAGEGDITLEELRAALRKVSEAEDKGVATISDQEVAEIFSSLDFDRSGKVHWTEFLAATINLSQQDETMLRKAFERLDCDGSGSISLENLRDLCGADASESDLSAMINSADHKNSGAVEWEDFLFTMKALRRRNTLTSLRTAAEAERAAADATAGTATKAAQDGDGSGV